MQNAGTDFLVSNTIYIIIDLRGCSEPFLEGGAAELLNEDYFFSDEISLKFPNQPKFLMCSQISPSKMWREHS